MSPQGASRRGKRAAILIGHGGVPTDFSPALVGELMALEKRRLKTGGPMPKREAELDDMIRHWPRTRKTEPYKSGLEAILQSLRGSLRGWRVIPAFNEFCTPTVAEAAAALVDGGYKTIVLITTMYTRGGIHSENEIPRIVKKLKKKHRGVDFRYAWPFPDKNVASFLSVHIRRAVKTSSRSRTR